MGEDGLVFSKVSVSLGGTQVLNQVSFAVAPGEFVSLVGQNGAGKSTLLRCALGIISSWQGDISLYGRSVRVLNQRQLARHLAYVPQNGTSVFPQTVYEFVMLGRFARLNWWGVAQRSDEEAVERALELTGTQEFAGRRISSLSGGERQRVVIAAALAHQPEVLLLDEVCHFLDPQHEAEVQALLDRVNRENKVSVLSVTHDLNRAAFHSDRIIALQEGRVIFAGPPCEFMCESRLEHVYQKKFTLVRHPQRDVRLVVPGE